MLEPLNIWKWKYRAQKTSTFLLTANINSNLTEGLCTKFADVFFACCIFYSYLPKTQKAEKLCVAVLLIFGKEVVQDKNRFCIGIVQVQQ